MADFHYHGTFKESLAMLADILSLGLGLKIVHDPGAFTTNQPRWFDIVDDELAQLLEGRPYFFIGGPFTHHALHFDPRVNDRPGYNIQVAKGGPVLRGNLAHIRDVYGVPSLMMGDIGYQPHYFNPITQDWDPPSDDLKDAYRAIVRRMKRHMKQKKLNMKFWITPEAWRLWREGKVRFIPWNAIEDGRGDLTYPFPPSDEE
jgi:hypothetical protein